MDVGVHDTLSGDLIGIDQDIAALGILFFVNRTSGLLVLCLALFVIYRHSANIQRIKNGTESKIGKKKK